MSKEASAILISDYHQQRLEESKNHLLGGVASTNELPRELLDELAGVWPKPILISSIRHVKIDPPPQFILGSLYFRQLVEAVSDQTDSYHTVWESHPRGMGAVKIVCPTAEDVVVDSLSPDLPNFTTWRKVQAVKDRLENALDPNLWSKLRQRVGGSINVSLQKLQSEYQVALQASGDSTLAEFAKEVETRLSYGMFGNIWGLVPESTPYTSSDFKRRINRTLRIIDDRVTLESLLASAVDEKTAGNLFAGGTGDRLIRIGFSVKKNRFQISEFDSIDPKIKYVDRKGIDKTQVFQLLEQDEIVPTGLPTFIAVAAVSAVRPVAHYGNEYGTPNQVLKGWTNNGIVDLGGYRSVTEDFRDCWAPVVVKNNEGQLIPFTLSSLYVWSDAYGLDTEALLLKSLQTGGPIEVARP